MIKFLTGFGIFVGYYIIVLISFLAIKAIFEPPRELFRKMLHIMCAMSIFILIHEFDKWYLAVLNLAIFSLALYPALSYLERFPKVMEVLVQRKSGEIRLSMILIYVAMSILIVIFWGWFGEQWKYILLAHGMSNPEASTLGVYIHGLAGDSAAPELGVHSIIADDIIDNISDVLQRRTL